MSVHAQLEHDLRKLPEKVRASTLAEVARSLASEMDDGPGARDLASLAKELRATLVELEARANQVPSEVDPIDASESRGPAPISLDSRRRA